MRNISVRAALPLADVMLPARRQVEIGTIALGHLIKALKRYFFRMRCLPMSDYSAHYSYWSSPNSPIMRSLSSISIGRVTYRSGCRGAAFPSWAEFLV